MRLVRPRPPIPYVPQCHLRPFQVWVQRQDRPQAPFLLRQAIRPSRQPRPGTDLENARANAVAGDEMSRESAKAINHRRFPLFHYLCLAVKCSASISDYQRPTPAGFPAYRRRLFLAGLLFGLALLGLFVLVE
jgi:hypothetical protein